MNECGSGGSNRGGENTTSLQSNKSQRSQKSGGLSNRWWRIFAKQLRHDYPKLTYGHR